MNTAPFSVSKTSVHPEVSSPIPSIYSRPIKFLGRIINASVLDRNSSAELTDKLLVELGVIDESHFTGTQKLWILQHLLIDFSWASLMTMLANLTSFCLASTYDSLSSPTNLKKYRVTTADMCTLCSKDVYTFTHILGACNVLLLQ